MTHDVVSIIGAGGMGQAIARRIGSGRELLLADIDHSSLSGVAQKLRDEGHHVTTQLVDVTDRDSVAELGAAAAALGRVTHIAHTAGLSPVQASTEAIIRVDLLGVALMLEEFARIVAPGGAGVVIASMAGHMSAPLSADQERALAATPAAELLALSFLSPDAVGDPGAAYVLAKRANVLRVQAAAASWGERAARINSISPGIVSTSMGQQELAGDTAEQMQAMVSMSAARRLGTPYDIAASAAFLLDPQSSSFVTGTDLLVDGGVVAAVRALS